MASSSSSESPLTVATRRSIQKLFPMGSILSSGRDNPITLHTAVSNDNSNSNNNLFACIWSLIAETMVVTVVLPRKTKEAIASLVSERNACPVCLAAHSFMGITAIVVDQNGSGKSKKKDNHNSSSEDKQLQHDQALQYAELLLSEMKLSKRKCGAVMTANDAASTAGSDDKRSMSSGNSVGSGTLSTASSSMDLMDDSDDEEDGQKKRRRKEKRKRKKSRRRNKKFTHLTPTAKSEVALVVMLFDHMNRVVSVIMGDEMSTAMFGVPRSLARAMEAPKAVKMMSRWMAPLVSGTFKVKHAPGVTLSLFENNTSSSSSLPTNLQGVLLAGLERANAVGRLVDWVESYERDILLKQDLVSKHLIRFLDRTLNEPHEGVNFYAPDDVAQWMDETMKKEVTAAIMGDDVSEASQEMNQSSNHNYSILATERAIAMVLLLASLAPQTAYQSPYWKDLVHRVGDNTARSIVIWWSLRTTFSECQGLDQPIDQATLLTLLTTAGVAPQ